MKFNYRLALMSDDNEYFWLDIANNDYDIRRISNYAAFIKWIHEEWQELIFTPPSPKLPPIYDDFKLPGNIISNPNFNKLYLVDWDKVENFSDVKLILQAVQFSFGSEHKHFDKIKHLLSEEI